MTADAVVIVDTSTSMREEVDPTRASLLVTKLLADIVPGDLAVVRLLDIDDDKDVIPAGRPDHCPVPGRPDAHGYPGSGDGWEADARSKSSSPSPVRAR